MFDWLRRNQEARAEQVVVQERALGNSLPMLESCPNEQTLPDGGSVVTVGPAQALAAAVDGPTAEASVAGRVGEECEPAGPIEHYLNGVAEHHRQAVRLLFWHGHE